MAGARGRLGGGDRASRHPRATRAARALPALRRRATGVVAGRAERHPPGRATSRSARTRTSSAPARRARSSRAGPRSPVPSSQALGIVPQDVAARGSTVRPAIVPGTSTRPPWMQFAGRWGEAQYAGFPGVDPLAFGAGPEGPAFHTIWRQPVRRAADLAVRLTTRDQGDPDDEGLVPTEAAAHRRRDLRRGGVDRPAGVRRVVSGRRVRLPPRTSPSRPGPVPSSRCRPATRPRSSPSPA